MALLPAGALFTRTGRRVIAVVAGVVVALLLGLGAMISSMAAVASVPGWSWGSGCTFDTGKAGELTITNSTTGGKVELGASQMQNAATILKIAQELGLPQQASKIALMTGLQESKLKMYANSSVPESLTFPHEAVGSDHDSVNVFQQRLHWGTIAELMDLDYATRAFFGGPTGPNHGSPRGLLDIPGWDTMTPGQAAQAVQVSAFPDHYDGWAGAAEEIIAAVSGGTTCVKPIGDGGDGRNGWGGFENGRIPLEALTPIPWAPKHLLREDASVALAAMNEAWKARFGYEMPINDAYRDYEGQVQAREDWCRRGKCNNAADPGTSNHGWALAVDIQVGWNDAEYQWLKQNGSLYGWVHPPFAEPGGSAPEPWHWEFAGLAAAA